MQQDFTGHCEDRHCRVIIGQTMRQGRHNRSDCMNIKKYGPYHTAEEIYTEFDELIVKGCGGASVTLGASVQGRPLRAWSAGPSAGAPAIIYIAQCHAIEFIATEQCLAIARSLASERRDLLEKVKIWFFPVMNPDGHDKVCRLLGKHLIPLVKTNANRVDINRNFPVGFYEPHVGGVMAGSHKKTINYHGPSPLSEPESLALVRLVDMARPSISLALHSFGEKICWPPCHNKSVCPDAGLYKSITGGMAALQPHPYKTHPDNELYLTYGDINDWLYYERDVLGILLEIGPMGMARHLPASLWNIFMWANPGDVAATTANNTAACLHLADLAARGVRKGAMPVV